MAKYTDDVKKQCVEKIKQGVAMTVVSKELGPNPKAIARYCKAAGVDIPKKEKKPKAEKKEGDEKKAVPKAPVKQ